MTFSLLSNANAASSQPLSKQENQYVDYESCGMPDHILVHPRVLSRMIHLRASQIQASPGRSNRSGELLRMDEVMVAIGPVISIPGIGDIPNGEYVGELKEGKPHGRGVAIYKCHPGRKNWKRYQGDWENGKFHGFGLLILRHGATYDGQWQVGLLHGHAVVFEADRYQRRYEGEYVYGKKQGYGRETWGNGEVQVYEGEWQDDKFHGHGRLVNAFGDVYEGNFAESAVSGSGRITWENGDVYEGECYGQFLYKKGDAGQWEFYQDRPWSVNFCGFMRGEGTLTRADAVLTGFWKGGRLWSGTLSSGEVRYTVVEGIKWLGNQKVGRVSKVYNCFCCSIQ